MSIENRRAKDDPGRTSRHSADAEPELSAADQASWDTLSAELRALTRGRRQTPSEQLLREARDQR